MYLRGRLIDGVPRRGRPFVIIRCMNLAMQLLENELFGHVRERSSALSILGPAVLKPPTAAPCCSTNHPLDWWAGAELNCRHEDFQSCDP
jgi:hypothetical protein